MGLDVDGDDLTRVKARFTATYRGLHLPGMTINPLPLSGDSPPPVNVQVDALLDAVANDEEPEGQRRAVEALVKQGMGQEAAAQLSLKLDNDDRDVVENARELLVRIRSSAVPALLRVMDEGDPRAAREAMRALGDIGDPRAAKHLVQKVRDKNWWIRAAAGGALGGLRGEDTRLALEQLLRDDDEDVRRTAMTALRLRGSTESANAISDLLGDPVFSVRFAARDALVALGVPCPQHVFSLVGSDRPEIRHLSIQTSGELANRQSIRQFLPVLLGLLDGGDWADRAFAAEAICLLGAREACDDLQASLAKETNGLVKAKAQAALKATKLCEP